MDAILKERFCEEFFKFIQTNPDKPWDWELLSENPSISWKSVQENPDKPWNWQELGNNKMGYPHTKKIEKVKEAVYLKVLQKHNNLLGYDKRLNRFNIWLFMEHLV